MGTLVMTGASRGIGRAAAAEFARAQAVDHLLLLTRGNSGDELVRQLRAESGRQAVSAISCELDSRSSIAAAAAQIRRQVDSGEIPALSGVVGNAGVTRSSGDQATVDGYEYTFGVNVLANHLLLALLRDYLQRGRIFITGSEVHFGDFAHSKGAAPPPKWAAVDEVAKPGEPTYFAGRQAYATSKLGVVYLVHSWARELPDDLEIYSYNPGFVPGTEIARDADRVTQFVVRRLLHVMRLTPWATGPRAAGRKLARSFLGGSPGPSGSYLDRGRLVASSSESYNGEREAELWEFCEAALP